MPPLTVTVTAAGRDLNSRRSGGGDGEGGGGWSIVTCDSIMCVAETGAGYRSDAAVGRVECDPGVQECERAPNATCTSAKWGPAAVWNEHTGTKGERTHLSVEEEDRATEDRQSPCCHRSAGAT